MRKGSKSGAPAEIGRYHMYGSHGEKYVQRVNQASNPHFPKYDFDLKLEQVECLSYLI